MLITASIAVYRGLDLIRILQKKNIKIQPMITNSVENFINPTLISAISGTEVLKKDSWKMEHISASRDVDVILVCPASADFIGKIANGIGGELALDTILARPQDIPVIICPAMNTQMWLNKAVGDNITKLKNYGFVIIEPQEGVLACNEEGIGKLADIEKIAEFTEYYATPKSLAGKKAVVTTGGTVEKLDEVRFLSNFSSGKQGLSVARELALAGAEVHLIYANISAPISPLIHTKTQALSSREMFKTVQDSMPCDIFVSVAAVSDFYPVNCASGKVKKQDFERNIKLELSPDILSFVGNLKTCRPHCVVGFAAEDENLENSVRVKALQKNCDILIGNEIDSGKIFGADHTNAIIFNRLNPDLEPFCGTKEKLSKKILENVKKMF